VFHNAWACSDRQPSFPQLDSIKSHKKKFTEF
jgi:hypothetical protein